MTTPTAFLDMPRAGSQSDGHYAPAPRLGTSQNVSYAASGGAAQLGAVFGLYTQMIQITVWPSPTAAGVRIAIGTAPVADATSAGVPSGAIVYYRTAPGERISVLSQDGSAGTVNVVECMSR